MKIITFVRRYQLRIKRGGHPLWKATIFDEGILPLLQTMLPGKVRFTGPFGISSRVMLVWDNAGRSRSMELRPGSIFGGDPFAGCGIEVTDLDSDNGRFKPMTIGHLNGLHHKTRALPRTMTVRGLARLLKKATSYRTPRIH